MIRTPLLAALTLLFEQRVVKSRGAPISQLEPPPAAIETAA